MEVLPALCFAVLGACLASFINVCADRIPAGRSIAFPPSRCDACGHALSAADLFPVVSYLVLRGRCRFCRAAIPRRVLWVETMGAVLFALLYLRFGLTLTFGVVAVYAAVLGAIAIIDLEHRIIPNIIVYPAAAVIAVANIFLPQPGLVPALIGTALGFGLLLIPALVMPGGMGFGDVKMAALMGLMTGWKLVLVALFVAIVLAGTISILLVATRLRGRKDTIPFGPFLSGGTFIALVWGGSILTFYLGMFGMGT